MLRNRELLVESPEEEPVLKSIAPVECRDLNYIGCPFCQSNLLRNGFSYTVRLGWTEEKEPGDAWPMLMRNDQSDQHQATCKSCQTYLPPDLAKRLRDWFLVTHGIHVEALRWCGDPALPRQGGPSRGREESMPPDVRSPEV